MKYRFLVIDNKEGDAELAKVELYAAHRAGQCEGEIEDVTVLVAKDSVSLLPLAQAALKSQWYHGTVLDILYSEEPDGGIKLWSALKTDERINGGKLVVFTKGGAESIPGFNAFVKNHATGGLCQSAKKEDRIAHLRHAFFSAGL